ncbi:hypothetical protein [Aeromicrobium sp. REDSEA-S38_B2]|uniref:hypothetical protein n=1 Tax=Aeromicrobium sp. REDSEA-S38_B2 TaxID=1811528 RepID=UPI000AE51301|nr:hypothetical protein [Aeromicrobium sp. REDSEA-S38_B2]
MRGFLAAVSGLVAVVALAVALPAAWVAASVADEDGFVSLSRDVVTDGAVQDAASDLLTTRLEREAGLPAQLAETGRRLLERATDRVFDDPQLSGAWAQTLRRTHAALLDDPAAASGQVPVPLDLAPLARLAAERTDGLVDAPDRLVVELPGGPDARALRLVDESPGLALAAGLVAAVGALVALPVAAAGLDAGLARLARERTVDASTGDGLQTALVRALADVGVTSFDGWLVWTALSGAVLAVLGVVVALVGRRSA